jgi:hypothetical protein
MPGCVQVLGEPGVSPQAHPAVITSAAITPAARPGSALAAGRGQLRFSTL